MVIFIDYFLELRRNKSGWELCVHIQSTCIHPQQHLVSLTKSVSCFCGTSSLLFTHTQVDGTCDGMMLLVSFWQKNPQKNKSSGHHFYSTINNENLFQTQSWSWCFGWCSIQMRHTSCAAHLLILSLLVNDQLVNFFPLNKNTGNCHNLLVLIITVYNKCYWDDSPGSILYITRNMRSFSDSINSNQNRTDL